MWSVVTCLFPALGLFLVEMFVAKIIEIENWIFLLVLWYFSIICHLIYAAIKSMFSAFRQRSNNAIKNVKFPWIFDFLVVRHILPWIRWLTKWSDQLGSRTEGKPRTAIKFGSTSSSSDSLIRTQTRFCPV